MQLRMLSSGGAGGQAWGSAALHNLHPEAVMLPSQPQLQPECHQSLPLALVMSFAAVPAGLLPSQCAATDWDLTGHYSWDVERLCDQRHGCPEDPADNV